VGNFPKEDSSQEIPGEVISLLKSSQIGYISVTSKKGGLYTYPVAFHYADYKIYMMTPEGSAKMKFMKENPSVSFIVDNRKLATSACGVMLQGQAKVFSIVSLAKSIVSLGPKMASFAKKYPGMFTFYARGKELPPDRKLYKYRVIRIDPTKFVFWTGYKFGRYLPPKRTEGSADSLVLKDGESAGKIAGLLDSADGEEEIDSIPVDGDWLNELESAAAQGLVTGEERRLMGSFRVSPEELGTVPKAGETTSGEKKLLKKWKQERSSA